MIHKTIKIFDRTCKFNEDGSGMAVGRSSYKSRIKKTTYWFLFLPIYSFEEEISSNR